MLDTDLERGRALARAALARYLDMRNYANSWRRLGFDDPDLTGGGSDRLVDALVVIGDTARIAERVREHLDAGADHVCVQLIVGEGTDRAPGYRALAEALLD